MKEKLTIPLCCVTQQGQSVKHAFLLSELCPINLLGRDLMCRLSICLISTPDGLQVVNVTDFHQDTFTGLKLSNPYVYQWKIVRTPVITDLMQNICNIISPVDTEFMSPLDLHCIASVSNGPDKPYEEN